MKMKYMEAGFQVDKFLQAFLVVLPMACLLDAAEPTEARTAEPARIFGSHMVLQQDEPIKIWGTAPAGQAVKVMLGDDQRETQADAQGSWLVELPARQASYEPLVLEINEVSFDDILIGEVWLCSGQSNMGFPMKNIDDRDRFLAEAGNPHLRIASHDGASGAPGANLWKDAWPEASLARCNTRDFFKIKWDVSTPDLARSTSAVAWILGSELQRKLDVPVGIVEVSFGGSALNNWISPEALKRDPVSSSLYEKDWLSNEEVKPEHRKRAVAAFQKVMGECKPRVKGQKVFNDGAPYLVGRMPYRWLCEPGFLFEAGIAPLQHLAFRGVLWYQGEADAGDKATIERAETYFPMLVKSWRDHFGREFPFFFVQLPGFKEKTWPLFRELQRHAEKQLPNMTMIVTIDTGEEKDIHPKDKGPVGLRAAHMALRNAYGKDELLGFPSVAETTLVGGELRVTFRECGKGFQAVSGVVPGFEVADSAGVFHTAEARITAPDTITITLPIAAPASLRYGWQPFPNPPLKLYNSDGLPAGPFLIELRDGGKGSS